MLVLAALTTYLFTYCSLALHRSHAICPALHSSWYMFRRILNLIAAMHQ